MCITVAGSSRVYKISSFHTALKEATMAFHLTATAFRNGGFIPKKFTCDGPDISPELAWTEPPTGTKSLALIMDDPDAPAGTWVHWVLYDLPGDVAS